MKVYIYTHDPMLTLCYLPDTAIDLFGEDCLEDCTEVPEKLANEINETYSKLVELSKELKKIRDSNSKW